MSQNNEPQATQADLNKSQQAGGGDLKPGQDQDQTLSQGKDRDDQSLAGEEAKSFQASQANPAEGKAEEETRQAAKDGLGEQDTETETDAEPDTQADTSNI